jgi:hypothetical protein
MNQEPPIETFRITKWITVNFWAWLAGFFATLLVIFAMEAVHLGNQSMIGIGMGAGVGWVQGRYLKKFGIDSVKWFLYCFAGLSISYISYDILVIFWPISPDDYLFIFTFIGGLLAGVFQWWFMLRRLYSKSFFWPILYSIGWLFAHSICLELVAWVNQHKIHDSPWVMVPLVVGIILSGGPFLALITGTLLSRILNRGRGEP